MAIVKFGVTVVGVRGTIGGLTFSANKSSPYAKQWSRGANPKTSLQTSQRALLATMPAAWRSLTPAEQTAWDTFAALPAQELFNSLGESFFLSGWGWFNKINIRLLAMGRSIRDAVPVQARPAAPTITDLEFPFADGETAFVQYASGAFGPDFDLVLEVAQAGSTGRLSPPSTFAEFLVLQNPDDTQSGFATAYVNRLGIGNSSLKGFLRLYRQTTDGLRSAAGSAAFVAADSSPFAPTALNYDGVNDFALRGADLTGVVNSKTWSEAGWFKIDGGAGTFRTIRSNTGSRWEILLDDNNQLRFFARDSAGATAFSARTVATFAADSTWRSYLLAVDTAAPSFVVYIDDVLAPLTADSIVTDAVMDYSQADHSFGARVDGTIPWDGCLSSFWSSTTSALDFSDVAVRRIFLSPNGEPLDLGDSGQLPTGAPPIIYFPGGDASSNVGGGGNYVNQAGASACSDAP